MKDASAIARVAVGATLFLWLSGCAGYVIKKETNSVVGKPVSAVIAKLGLPTEHRVIAGRKVYISSTSNFVEGTNCKCQIRAILDDKDIITSWDYDGNEGGCGSFITKLAPLFG
jgi:hypothetical protein